MKKSGQFLFETQLKWQMETCGLLSSRVISEPIRVAAPSNLKAMDGSLWSPEHLFLGAINSSFMTTVLYYAKKKGLELSGFECETIGQVEFKNGKYKFTEVNVYPKIRVEKPSSEDPAKEIIELAKQNCLVTRSLNVIVYYHPFYEIRQNADKREKINTKEKREVFF